MFMKLIGGLLLSVGYLFHQSLSECTSFPFSVSVIRFRFKTPTIIYKQYAGLLFIYSMIILIEKRSLIAGLLKPQGLVN